MATAEPIPAITKRIVERFRPLQIILFGSWARGDARSDSDVDLLVVFPHVEDQDKVWRDIRETLREFRVPHDVVVTTPDEIVRRGNLVGTVLRPALRDGKVLYDVRTGMVEWSSNEAGEQSAMPKGGMVTDAERLGETRRWLEKAREDLRIAELVGGGDDASPSTACYLAQQAVEKALKAALIFLQIEFGRTHNLDQLRSLLPADWSVTAEHPALKGLSEWVFKARYPGSWSDPTELDARNATRQARAVWESLLKDLSDQGFDVSGHR